MPLTSLIDTGIFTWLILPLLIFVARIFDVSLGTIRIVFIAKGMKYLAPLVGFFEVIIWLLAIRVIMQNLNNAVCYLAYGAGFAMGTFIGMQIENKLALGTLVLRIITQKDSSELIDYLRSKGYGVTAVDGHGITGKVQVIFLIIRRVDFEEVAEAIFRFNPKAFYTAENVNFAKDGTFPLRKFRPIPLPFPGTFRFWRKGK